MPYASLLLLTERYGERMVRELTDRSEPKTGAIDSDVVDRGLEDADAVVDGYISTRYKLPLETTPPLLADLAAQVAIYKLHRFNPPGNIKEDYERALAELGKISKGMIKLDVAGVEPEGSGSGGVVTTDRDRPFTEANLKGFI